MEIGTTIRNMGPAATVECIQHCAARAESAGLQHIWVVDHIAIPPDDAEGSNGRWIDPLPLLAYLAAATQNIQIGVSVLVLPYRPALPTAKWIASIQELSKERLLLGVGPGWMPAEFKALGVDKRKRGAITDATVELIRECFGAEDDIVEVNGQAFYFRPNPKMPPLFVGGMTDAALNRALRYGAGWLPVGIDPEKLTPRIERLNELATEANVTRPDIIAIGPLPDEQNQAADWLGKCADLGVKGYIQVSRYSNETEFDVIVARLEDLQTQLGS